MKVWLMLVSEEAASKKWCPLVRIIAPEQYGRAYNNRGTDTVDDKDVNCIGSRCMAWRELDTRSGRGYCGFAGVPHTHGGGD